MGGDEEGRKLEEERRGSRRAIINPSICFGSSCFSFRRARPKVGQLLLSRLRPLDPYRIWKRATRSLLEENLARVPREEYTSLQIGLAKSLVDV